MTELIDIPVEGGKLPVHRSVPGSTPAPGIVVVQEIFGLSPYIMDRCGDLARAGYVVYAPELYWRLPQQPAFDEAADDYVQQGVAAASGLDWPTTIADVSSALDALRADEACNGKVALLGFCFGGGVAFNVAAQNTPDALVSYYGSALPTLLEMAPQVTCPSLHHFGTSDSYIPLSMVEQIRDAVSATNPQVRFELYEGADHAFDNPNPMFHHADSAQRAWQTTLEFLRTHLGSDS